MAIQDRVKILIGKTIHIILAESGLSLDQKYAYPHDIKIIEVSVFLI